MRARARIGATCSCPRQSRTGVVSRAEHESEAAAAAGFWQRRRLRGTAAHRCSRRCSGAAVSSLRVGRMRASQPMNFDELASAPKLEHETTRLRRHTVGIRDARCTVSLNARDRATALGFDRVYPPEAPGTGAPRRTSFWGPSGATAQDGARWRDDGATTRTGSPNRVVSVGPPLYLSSVVPSCTVEERRARR